MLKQSLSWLMAGSLVFALLGAPPVAAKSKTEKEAQWAAKVKAGVAEREARAGNGFHQQTDARDALCGRPGVATSKPLGQWIERGLQLSLGLLPRQPSISKTVPCQFPPRNVCSPHN